jgi:hypothetical protein
MNFPLIGQVTYTFTPSFGNMDAGRTDILGSGGRVLVGMLQPLVWLFVEIFTRTLEVTL